MTTSSPFAQIADRVERLLVRQTALQTANLSLAEQVTALTQERDSLKLRLHAARARVDALLDRLPEAIATPAAPPSTPAPVALIESESPQ